MKPEEVLIKIKTEITDEKKDINEKMIDDLVMNIFLKNMGYERIDVKNILNVDCNTILVIVLLFHIIMSLMLIRR